MAASEDFQAKLAQGRLWPPPIAEFLGFTLVSLTQGEATYEMPVDSRFASPMGTVHGGILCDLSDAAMATAFASTLADGETMTTLELKINFLKPVWQGRLRAIGKVVKRGKSVGLVDCDVFDEHESLVARSSSTCMVLRGDQAIGR